jgi:hypothetical protein
VTGNANGRAPSNSRRLCRNQRCRLWNRPCNAIRARAGADDAGVAATGTNSAMRPPPGYRAAQQRQP